MYDEIRYEGVIEDDVLVLCGEVERLEVGPVDVIVELLGGETYTLEYDSRQRTAAWLPTDEDGEEDGTITIDVREALTDWVYTETFVANVRASPIEAAVSGSDGCSLRTAVFAEQVAMIWDAKGDITV